ncbi:MAG: hypothetical protein ACE5Q6_11940 [Dehalococcoidia bacterium]
MSASQVLAEARRRGVELIAQGDRLIYRGPRGQLSEDLLIDLKRYKVELLILLDPSNDRESDINPIDPGLLAWASQLAEQGLLLDQAVTFVEEPLRTLSITDVSSYVNRQLKYFYRARFERQTGGRPGFPPEWWQEREAAAIGGLIALRGALEQRNSCKEQEPYGNTRSS